MRRSLLILLGLVAAASYMLGNPVVRTVYSCHGALTSVGISEPETIFFVDNRPAWWNFLAEGGGSVMLELKGDQDFFTGLYRANTMLVFWGGNAVYGGQFSTVSNSLQFTIDEDTTFKGTCTQPD